MQKIIEKHLLNRSFLSYFLLPLSWKFALLQILRRKFIFSKYKSKCKIISIGNIVSGGSGKTPFTIFLAKYLQKQGRRVAVSHRGYKGKFEHLNKLLSDEKEVFNFAKDAGDEAYILAEKLIGIPVVVGKNRINSIEILVKKFPNLDCIILDDSFQNLKVQHDLDFVIFNSIGGIGNGFVLPAGILREPLSALKYCNYIIFNGDGKIPLEITKFEKPILRGNYKIKRFYDQQKEEISITKLKNSKIALLSGIGQPSSFEKTVQTCDINFEKHFAFSDHYSYQNKVKLEEIKGFDYILTTEKDFAKLQFIEHNLPLVMVEVELVLQKNIYTTIFP